MDTALVEKVRHRAEDRCEYCRIGRGFDDAPFEIDHVIARKHGGASTLGNLALSCFHCNAFKGPNIAGLDPQTRGLTPLFHPRRHKWPRPFRWQRATLIGRTPIGRVTIAVLNINDPFRVELREGLIEEGVFPSE